MSRAGVGGGLVGAMLGLALIASGESAHAETVTEQFLFTGAPETFVVPDGVTELVVTACGAEGGAAAASGNGIDATPTPGAPGGCATGTVAVQPGQVLTIVVGGAGGDARANTTLAPTVTAEADGGHGGFNGGWDGADASIHIDVPDQTPPCQQLRSAGASAAGGSGGASDVRLGGDELADRALVGGGGGSAGGDGVWAPLTSTPAPCPSTAGQPGTPTFTPGGAPGAGGGDPADAGGDGADAGAVPGGEGGGAGSADAGGTAGAGGGNGAPGAAGSEGTGGGGGVGVNDLNGALISAAGSGGGGMFGGGGGGSGGLEEETGDAAGGGGGGGGGSFGPAGSTFQTGVRSGNGIVTIAYESTRAAPAQAVEAGPRFTG